MPTLKTFADRTGLPRRRRWSDVYADVKAARAVIEVAAEAAALQEDTVPAVPEPPKPDPMSLVPMPDWFDHKQQDQWCLAQIPKPTTGLPTPANPGRLFRVSGYAKKVEDVARFMVRGHYDWLQMGNDTPETVAKHGPVPKTDQIYQCPGIRHTFHYVPPANRRTRE